MGFDCESGRMDFVRLRRESYRRSIFLDGRTVTADPVIRSIPIADVLRALPDTPRPPMHFIFHAAFCCSTLLARHLEALPALVVLKEPEILAQLAERSHRLRSAAEREAWDKMLSVVQKLITQTGAGQQAVVVKLNDTDRRELRNRATVFCAPDDLRQSRFRLAGLSASLRTASRSARERTD
jgi:hypothetical protein